MSWKREQVLVTGAGGFIGSHLVERLLSEGASVRAFIRYTSRASAGFLDEVSPQLRDGLEIVRGDVRDPDAVRRAAKGCTTLFSLAALIGIPYSYVHPREVVETNVMGTLNVLEAAREHGGVDRVVHTSTSETYGTAEYVPMDEKHVLQGQSPYSASKIGADKLVESFHNAFGLQVSTLRPFNTYGPRQSARAVIPTIISQLLRGPRVKLGNLDPRRDLTFVGDTVDGFVRIAKSPNTVGRVVNVGNGQDISIGELAHAIAAAMGREIELVTDNERVRPTDSEVDRLLADNSLARELMGWEPRVSLHEGMRRTAEWIEANQ